MVSTEVFPREGAEWTNIWITEALYYDRTRVACIGDSITFNYRPIVGNIFYPQNIMIDMLAGSRMCGDPAFYKELEMFFGPASGYKYDVIHFNNGLHGCCNNTQLDLDIYVKGYKECIELIRRLQPEAKIILATSTHMTFEDHTPELLKKKNDMVIERNEFVRRYAEENGYMLNDLYKIVAGHNDEYPQVDGVHFGEEGKKVLADAVVDLVNKALGRENVSAE